jgi:hypothetical protein
MLVGATTAHAQVLVAAVLVGLVQIILGITLVMAALDCSQVFPGLLLFTLAVVAAETDGPMPLELEDLELVAMAATEL